MNMDERQFFEWFNSDAPSDEERKLFDLVCTYEDYFQDMLFRPGTVTHDLIMCQAKQKDSTEWVNTEEALPEELELFSLTFLKYEVKALDNDVLGFYKKDEQLLCVSPEGLQNNYTVLHEMIHVYESLINELPLYFHDMVYWALYKGLQKKIPRLEDIISNHAHILTQKTLYEEGGLHDILFLLKSFDLDIRLGYSLGTIFGYGKTDEFKAYTYADQ